MGIFMVWVECKEWLPEAYISVLLYVYSPGRESFFIVEGFINDQAVWYLRGIFGSTPVPLECKVTHWTLYPNAPEIKRLPE
jgi:hypothetical protein